MVLTIISLTHFDINYFCSERELNILTKAAKIRFSYKLIFENCLKSFILI